MTRLLTTILLVSQIFSPLPVFAQQAIPAPENSDLSPVYFFAFEGGYILGVSPISDDLLAGCIAEISETPETPECFILEYNYDAIGNITSSTEAGVYTYDSFGGYTNPHAATNINSATSTYDNNGNLTNDVERTHTWDYRNRLKQSIAGPTYTYLYDHNNSRVKRSTPMSATITPSPYFSVEDGTNVKYVMGNGMILASIRGTGTSSMPYYLHPDHLGSTEKLTDASGTIAELSDYFPYGTTRINNQYILNDRKGFIGKDADTDTVLSYLEARYYKNKAGRFISQDPVFWEVGMTRDGKSVLENPQLQNSYGYAGNNPITYKDPEGRIAPLALLAIGYKIAMRYYNGANLFSDIVDRNIKNAHPDVFSQEQRDQANFRVGYGAAVTVLGELAGPLLGMPKAGIGLDVLGMAADGTDAWRQQQAQNEVENPNKKKVQDTESSLSTFPGGVGGSIFAPTNNSGGQIQIQPNINSSQNQQSSGGSGAAYRNQLIQQLIGLYQQLLAQQNQNSAADKK